jgi:hypothetical protein
MSIGIESKNVQIDSVWAEFYIIRRERMGMLGVVSEIYAVFIR